MDFFRGEYMDQYMAFFDSERLLRDLMYLESQKLDSELLGLFQNLHFVHGEHDKIAPLDELLSLTKEIELEIELDVEVVENNGHLLNF
jgi:hypothetical protein